LTIGQAPSDLYVESITSFAAPSTTFTLIPYSAVVYDMHSNYDTGTGRFTTSAAGDYQICASLISPASYELDVFLNGTREKAIGSFSAGAAGCRDLRLKSTDTVEIRVFQNSGSTVTFAPDPRWDWLTVRRIR